MVYTDNSAKLSFMTPSLTNPILSYSLNALYICKLSFISTNRKIHKWLIVVTIVPLDVLRTPDNHCQTCNITKQSNSYQRNLSKLLKHPIRIDSLINTNYQSNKNYN